MPAPLKNLCHAKHKFDFEGQKLKTNPFDRQKLKTNPFEGKPCNYFVQLSRGGTRPNHTTQTAVPCPLIFVLAGGGTGNLHNCPYSGVVFNFCHSPKNPWVSGSNPHSVKFFIKKSQCRV